MMNWKILLGLTVSYFVYLLIGAAIFQAVERPNEENVCQEAKLLLSEQIAHINNSFKNNETATLTDIQNLTKTVVQAVESGVLFNPDTFELTCASNWDFQGSFFFSGTVVTTIGYGHISPSTAGGQTLCIIYAIVGIPLFALMFSGYGERIAGLVIKIESKIKKGKLKRTWVQKIVMVLIVALSLILFCLVIPAAIFMAVENWEYREAFYYSFITVTTIGFGDFVVGINPEIDYIAIYRILVYFWILFGMAFMATVVSLMSDFFRETGKKHLDLEDDRVEEDGVGEGGRNGEETDANNLENGMQQTERDDVSEPPNEKFDAVTHVIPQNENSETESIGFPEKKLSVASM